MQVQAAGTVLPSFLTAGSTFTAAGAAAFASAWTRHEVPKGHTLLSPGSICRQLWAVEKGITRTYYLRDGKDVTDWISVEGTFAVSVVSFLTGGPDRRGIETLEPAVLWSVQAADLHRLYDTHPCVERFGRMLMSGGIVQMQQRFDDLHFSGAAERYRQLMEKSPGIIQRVPGHIVASYLGMTPETLSRIRAGRIS